MFKFLLGIALLVSAFFLAMTGVGIILAIPLGIIGLLLTVYGFFGVLSDGAKMASKPKR